MMFFMMLLLPPNGLELAEVLPENFYVIQKYDKKFNIRELNDVRHLGILGGDSLTEALGLCLEELGKQGIINLSKV